jgi:AraC-like DNA-binding protein
MIQSITRYLSHLRTHYALAVSVHFRAERLSALPHDVFRALLPYNSHRNRYCMEVKKSCSEKCLAAQKEIYEGKSEAHLRVCHAGVYEYIFPVTEEGKVIGFVAVSGYRGNTPTTLPALHALWESTLSEEGLPKELLLTVIPPLVVMLEGLFAKYAHREADEFDKMVAYLTEYHSATSLDALCTRFHRSRSYVSHLFNTKAGCSLRAFCNDLKLADAKALLEGTSLSVTEIAYAVGFGDASYFIKLFKDKYGGSPYKYRKEKTAVG